MKKMLMLLVAVIIFATAFSQNSKYTTSGGLTGALNMSKLRVTGNNVGDIAYKLQAGTAFGFWLNVPLNNKFSFEPQLLYTTNKFSPKDDPTGVFDIKTQNISIPLMLKLNAGKNIAFLAGYQADFLTGLNDDNNNVDKEDLKKFNSSITAGIELFPHNRVTFLARYLHGLTSLDNTGNPNTAVKFYTQNIYVGLKVKLFGHQKHQASTATAMEASTPVASKAAIKDKKKAFLEKDTDGDGVLDKVDNCPTVSGLAKYQGCPIPDTDGDGVNDEEDRCPKTEGLASNKGCPDLVVYFKRDEFLVDAEDEAQLDLVVRFLTNNADLSVVLEGHASTLGGTEYNQRLSQHRVDKSKQYIVSKGVAASRITTEALGEKMPIGDQKTEEGKAKSRRVHVKINF